MANVAANLIAFLAFLAFFNYMLSWFFSLVGHPEVTFEVCVSPYDVIEEDIQEQCAIIVCVIVKRHLSEDCQMFMNFI